MTIIQQQSFSSMKDVKKALRRVARVTTCIELLKDIEFRECVFSNITLRSVTNVKGCKVKIVNCNFVNCNIFFGDLETLSMDITSCSLIRTFIDATEGRKVKLRIEDSKIKHSELILYNVLLRKNKLAHNVIRLELMKKRDYIKDTLNYNTWWKNHFKEAPYADCYSVGSFGTYNGEVTYFPKVDVVIAGCWKGSLKQFEKEVRRVVEQDVMELLNVPAMDAVVGYFKVLQATID